MSTNNFISILRQVYCSENSSNIANSYLSFRNLLSSSETKSSTSSLTSNLNFSECTFSLPEISSSQIFRHVSPSANNGYCLILLLHQPIQNVLFFNILMDFTLFWLVCLKFYYKRCGTMTFYIKQHKNLMKVFTWFVFDM